MQSRRAMLVSLCALPLAAMIARPAAAAAPVFAVDGIALRGIDPVGYFTEGVPLRGLSRYALIWRGAEWHFASAAARDRFEMNPKAFAPRYGGYCAYRMAQGAFDGTDPAAWTIHGGRLYLKHGMTERALWHRDVAGHLAQADAHWQTLMR